jgi:hypothetical protein
MSLDSRTCAACNRTIDPGAKLCPFCGANPANGERFDTQALLQEVFRPREMSASDSVMEYAKQRQGAVTAISVFVGFLIIVGIHQFMMKRNANVVSDLPGVPLTEITDVTKKSEEAPVPMPKLDFQYDGSPQRMHTYIVERGAIAPAPPAPQPPVNRPSPSALPAERGEGGAQRRVPGASR